MSTPRAMIRSWRRMSTPPKTTVEVEPQVAAVRRGSSPRSGWPARAWAPGPAPGSCAAGLPALERRGGAGSAARTPRSCRCRSGRCPGGRGRPGRGEWPGPGWASARRSSRRRAHRATGQRGRDRRTWSSEGLSLRAAGRARSVVDRLRSRPPQGGQVWMPRVPGLSGRRAWPRQEAPRRGAHHAAGGRGSLLRCNIRCAFAPAKSRIWQALDQGSGRLILHPVRWETGW